MTSNWDKGLSIFLFFYGIIMFQYERPLGLLMMVPMGILMAASFRRDNYSSSTSYH